MIVLWSEWFGLHPPYWAGREAISHVRMGEVLSAVVESDGSRALLGLGLNVVEDGGGSTTNP